MKSHHNLFPLLILVIFLFLSGCQDIFSAKKAPKAVNGVLDLSDWDFKKDGTIKLDGEWEFYWEKLLEPNYFKRKNPPEKTGLINVPGLWNEYVVGETILSGDGYATFKLNVKLSSIKQVYGLKVLDISTAYRLWINESIISYNGKVGINKGNMQPQYLPGISTFRLEKPDFQVLIQVSNFFHKKGGVWSSLEIGTEQQIMQKRERLVGFELFLFGSLLIMAIYHFGLFWLRKNDRTTFYFGLFCLVIIVRILMSGERVFLSVFPDFDWEITAKMEFISFYLAGPVLSAFLENLYPKEYSKKIIRSFQVLGLIFSLIAIFTTVKIYSYTVMPYQIISLILCAYGIYGLVLAIAKQREGAILIIGGFIVLVLTVINDILRQNEFIHSVYLAPWGLFIFTFSQSFVLSIRFSKTFSRVELLSKTFQKFVPIKFTNRIGKAGIESIKIGNAEIDFITVLFSDMRSFTTLSENMTPQELLNFLNTYFERMSNPIHKHHGFIDKFIGDAIMALFDSPDDTEQAKDAVHAAIAMQEAVKVYNQHRNKRGYLPISIGIGINSGPVIIGTVGTKDRMDSTVLGDAVNVASRLEKLTKYYHSQIIISSQTWRLLEDDKSIRWRELDFINVKGKNKPVCIFEIFNNDDEPVRDCKQRILTLYHEGLMNYYSRNWDDALKLFKECLNEYHEDVVSQMYVDRCLKYKENPPGENWNGAVRLTEK